jgi:hypothetical protein
MVAVMAVMAVVTVVSKVIMVSIVIVNPNPAAAEVNPKAAAVVMVPMVTMVMVFAKCKTTRQNYGHCRQHHKTNSLDHRITPYRMGSFA